MSNILELSNPPWFVFKNDKTKKWGVTHFCTGDATKDKTIEQTFGIKKLCGFNPTIKWKTETPVCVACNKQVPDGITVLIKLKNTDL